MSELIADLFVSLDSCASAVDVGPYFGYAGPELDEWIQTELDRPQLIVLGRLTYEALASLSNGSDQGSRRLTESPKVVVSSTLSDRSSGRIPASSPATRSRRCLPLSATARCRCEPWAASRWCESGERRACGPIAPDGFPVDLRERRARAYLPGRRAAAMGTRPYAGPRRASRVARIPDDRLIWPADTHPTPAASDWRASPRIRRQRSPDRADQDGCAYIPKRYMPWRQSRCSSAPRLHPPSRKSGTPGAPDVSVGFSARLKWLGSSHRR